VGDWEEEWWGEVGKTQRQNVCHVRQIQTALMYFETPFSYDRNSSRAAFVGFHVTTSIHTISRIILPFSPHQPTSTVSKMSHNVPVSCCNSLIRLLMTHIW
jgi:hypothetical protein